MPKVKLSNLQAKRQMIKANLQKLKDGNTNAELGEIIGKSDVTFGKRLEEPGKMKIDEILLLCEACKVDVGRFFSEELKL